MLLFYVVLRFPVCDYSQLNQLSHRETSRHVCVLQQRREASFAAAKFTTPPMYSALHIRRERAIADHGGHLHPIAVRTEHVKNNCGSTPHDSIIHPPKMHLFEKKNPFRYTSAKRSLHCAVCSLLPSVLRSWVVLLSVEWLSRGPRRDFH